MNTKRRVFVEEYLTCWNATEAARRAEYKHPEVQGCRLLKNVKVQERIRERIADKMVTADEVILRLLEQARADQSAYLKADDNGEVGIDAAALIADGKGHLIKGIRETKYGQQIEFYDAQAALVHLGKHLALFTDRIVIEDWREEAKEKGLDPASIFERYVADAMAALASVDGTAEGGGVGRSEEEA